MLHGVSVTELDLEAHSFTLMSGDLQVTPASLTGLIIEEFLFRSRLLPQAHQMQPGGRPLFVGSVSKLTPTAS